MEAAVCHFPSGSSDFCEVIHIFAVLQVCISDVKLQALRIFLQEMCTVIRQVGCKGLIAHVFVTLQQHKS